MYVPITQKLKVTGISENYQIFTEVSLFLFKQYLKRKNDLWVSLLGQILYHDLTTKFNQNFHFKISLRKYGHDHSRVVGKVFIIRFNGIYMYLTDDSIQPQRKK